MVPEIVNMLPAVHTGEMVRSNKGDRNLNKYIYKPDCIVDYKKRMVGAEFLSRVLIPYSSQRHGVKGYRKIAERFLNICYIIYIYVWKKLNPQEASQTNLTFEKNGQLNDQFPLLWCAK